MFGSVGCGRGSSMSAKGPTFYISPTGFCQSCNAWRWRNLKNRCRGRIGEITQTILRYQARQRFLKFLVLQSQVCSIIISLWIGKLSPFLNINY